MENLSTAASSRRNSFAPHLKPQVNQKYKQIFSYQESLGSRGYSPQDRLRSNAHFKQELSLKLLKTINGTKYQNGSYFFTVGKQQRDQRFAEVFVDFFREMRGADPLAIQASISLADRFRGYSDVSRSEEHTIDCGDSSDIQTIHYSPTQAVIDELKQILENEYGLQGQFIGVLNLAGRKIGSSFKADTRDTCFHEFPLVSRLFPRCVDTLREIFNSLLIKEWLKNDIDGVKLYLNENDYVDRPRPSEEGLILSIRIWEKAKYCGEQQKKYDVEIAKKHRNELKDDISGIAISGGLSFITGNPSFVIGKSAQTIMNVIGNKVDPEGKDQAVQVLKLFGGAGLGGVMGGNPWDLGTSLGIDLMDLATRGDKTGKSENALRNLGGSVFKGVLTSDKKKIICHILGGVVAEAANQIPETTEDTPLDVRIARALLTNGDVQSHWIKGFVDKRFKDDPKPKTGGVLTPEEQEKYPKQEPTLEDLQRQAEYEKQLAEYEQWEKDVATYNEGQRLLGLAISSKEAEVKQAEKKMTRAFKRYEKAQGIFSSGDKEFNKYWKKRESYKTLAGELNTLKAQKGLPQEDPFQKFVRKPTKPKGFLGVLDRAYDKTCDVAKKVGLGPSEVTVGSVNLYTTKPSTVSDNYVLQYTPPPQISQYSSNMGQWEGIQALQQAQIFETNMAYQSPVQQPTLNYQQFWGQGLSRNVQMPPSDWSSLGKNEIIPYQNPQRNTRIQMAAFVPFEPMIEPSEAMHSIFVNDFTKSLPKGALKVMAAVCTLMLPDMSDVKGAEDPREHFKRVFNNGLKKYDKFVDIQDPNSFGSKAGEFVGETVALGGVGKVIRVAEGISMIGMACEGGFYGALMSEAHDTNKVAGIAFGFAAGGSASGVKLLFRGGGASMPLIDRVLVRPQGYSKEYNIIRAFNDPGYRSGFVTDKTFARLSDRNIRIIEQIETFVGKKSRAFYNEAGDIIIESKDGLRHFRIDLINPDPHKNPHSHVILYKASKNKKTKLLEERIFPVGVEPK